MRLSQPRLPQPPVLLITDRNQAHAPLDDVLAAAFAAGCRWASVREKDLTPDEQVALAKRLLRVARERQATLTLHGDPALARAAGVDGVHLSAGADAAAARNILGQGALIGISVHSVEEAQKLDPALIDYAIAGPAYETASKPGYGPALGAIGIGRMVAAAPVAIVAVGGITPASVAELRAAGAAGVAVMGGIMRAQDPAGAMERLIEAVLAR